MLQILRRKLWAAPLCLHGVLSAAPAGAQTTSEPAPEAAAEAAPEAPAEAAPEAPAEAAPKASTDAAPKDPADAAPKDPAEAAPESRWYGGHVLIADAAGLAVGAALALSLDDGERRPSDLGLVGSAWYGVGLVAAPAVHFAHQQPGRGMASMAMRSLVPPFAGVMGLVVGCVGNQEFDASCRRSGVTGGSLAGLAAVAVFDATVLAHSDGGTKQQEKPARYWYGWELLSMDAALLLGGAVAAARNPRTDSGKKLEPQLALWASDYVFGLFGGPILHAVHGEWGHGLASLGLRSFVGPLGAVAGLMGHCAAAAGVKGCSSTGATYGLLGGLLFVDLFDAFVLGYEDLPATEQAASDIGVRAGPGFIAVSGVWH